MFSGLFMLISAIGSLSDYPGVAQLRIEPGGVLVGDTFVEETSWTMSAHLRLLNEDVSYYQFSRSHPTSVTYFIYAGEVDLTLESVVLVNEEVHCSETHSVSMSLENQTTYVARPSWRCEVTIGRD
ncbi:MAG: hypothetical protein KKC01_12055 [Gammaproteobacteria bacterium]|nr:hypothetical protein [Gammaproteobacteria bacterium]